MARTHSELVKLLCTVLFTLYVDRVVGFVQPPGLRYMSVDMFTWCQMRESVAPRRGSAPSAGL